MPSQSRRRRCVATLRNDRYGSIDIAFSVGAVACVSTPLKLEWLCGSEQSVGADSTNHGTQ
jgi:hypothetical protein